MGKSKQNLLAAWIAIPLCLSACDRTSSQQENYLEQTWTFTDATAGDYSFDSAKLEIVSDTIRLKTAYENVSDSTAADFSAGSFIDADVDGDGYVKLATGQDAGIFRSQILNAGWPTLFESISWTPKYPAYKEFPVAAATETGYPTGNFSMEGNTLYYRFNDAAGTTTFTDLSETGNDATCAGIQCPNLGVSGKLLTAATFNGTVDFLTIPDSDTMDLGQRFTIMTWVRTNDTLGSILSHLDGAGGDGFSFGVGDASLGLTPGSVAFYSNQTGWVGGGTAITGNIWHHIAITYDGTTARFFLDGVQTAAAAMNAPDGAISDAFLGKDANGYFFAGTLDELAMFNRKLGASEILSAYKRGATRLKFQTRVCDDAACSGEEFTGPDFTNGSFYTELDSTTLLTLPSLDTLGVGQYFQYEVSLESDDASMSPSFKVASGQHRVHTGYFTTRTGIPFKGLLYVIETPDAGNLGIAKYQISNDGTNWFWHDGTSWTLATEASFDQANFSPELALTMYRFHRDIGTGDFYIRAFLRTLTGIPIMTDLTVHLLRR